MKYNIVLTIVFFEIKQDLNYEQATHINISHHKIKIPVFTISTVFRSFYDFKNEGVKFLYSYDVTQNMILTNTSKLCSYKVCLFSHVSTSLSSDWFKSSILS